MKFSKSFFLFTFFCYPRALTGAELSMQKTDIEYELSMVDQVGRHAELSKEAIADLKERAKTSCAQSNVRRPTEEMQRLLKKYARITGLQTACPALRDKLLFLAFEGIPTLPVKADELGKLLGITDFYVKHDQEPKFGYLIGEALGHNRRALLTFGNPSSYAALDLAKYATLVKLQLIWCMLRVESRWLRDLPTIQRVIKTHTAYNTIMRDSKDGEQQKLECLEQCREALERDYAMPFTCPSGGSPLTYLAQAEGIFNLVDQIKRQDMPTPDIIVTWTGTNTTGLMYGLKLVNALNYGKLPCRLLVIDFPPKDYPEGPSKLFNFVKERFREINEYIRALHPSFESLTITKDDLEVITGYEEIADSEKIMNSNEVTDSKEKGRKKLRVLPGYGEQELTFSAESLAQLPENQRISSVAALKSLAGLKKYLEERKIASNRILFWHSAGTQYPHPDTLTSFDVNKLDKSLHHYFPKNEQAGK